ncbi:hypothetical protein IHE44_0013798 [Lamprotornis superbus]|uniref:BZIP domain-containing protein n=1 Tax=Lamprotornis superbus TaxID=245042 RepID=A0A835NT36_9PASS|nr:hypothetical protein IHE44_0013798 [Lamprotornis superbus]
MTVTVTPQDGLLKPSLGGMHDKGMSPPYCGGLVTQTVLKLSRQSQGGSSPVKGCLSPASHVLSYGYRSPSLCSHKVEVEAVAAAYLVPLDEEEERRKRRREKNKVAAARCRNKKKERTEFLQRESERLELMNAELKAQIEELKQERQQLILMLNRHRPTCIVRTDSIKTPESEANPLLEQLEKK